MIKPIVEFMVSPEGRALVNEACARASQESMARGGKVATRINGQTVVMTQEEVAALRGENRYSECFGVSKNAREQPDIS